LPFQSEDFDWVLAAEVIADLAHHPACGANIKGYIFYGVLVCLTLKMIICWN
jgi:hypothetical protein